MECYRQPMRRAPSGVPVMRIVADTNTVSSGLLWPGTPRRLLDRARERTLTLCTSATLLAEVIARDKFVQRVQAAGLSAAELVQDYERLAEIVEPEPLPAPAHQGARAAADLSL
jgi:putative PIN family toxin of toxin-antitoxin system